MFECCVNLIKLDLSSFNTQNVKDMSWMFYGCENLIIIDLSLFNTQKVSMPNMFDGCVSLVKIKRKNFNEIKSFSKLIESRSFIVEV